MIVAFTGHRPNKIGGYKIPNPIYDHIASEIKKALKEINPERAISGMALGVDQWAAEICVELGIPFIVAIPFVGQESIWPQDSQDKYRRLLDKAEETKIICEGGYAAKKMQIRNKWMIDNCDVLIAVWNGTNGGTGNAVKYAQEINRKIYRINPKT